MKKILFLKVFICLLFFPLVSVHAVTLSVGGSEIGRIKVICNADNKAALATGVERIPLSDGVFVLRDSFNNIVAQGKTDVWGEIVFEAPLSKQSTTFTIEQIGAFTNYKIDTTPIRQVGFSPGQKEIEVVFINQKVHFTEYDEAFIMISCNLPNSNLIHMEPLLYENPIANVSFEIYEENTLIDTITTNKDGFAYLHHLPLRDYPVRYTVKIMAPDGYKNSGNVAQMSETITRTPQSSFMPSAGFLFGLEKETQIENATHSKPSDSASIHASAQNNTSNTTSGITDNGTIRVALKAGNSTTVSSNNALSADTNSTVEYDGEYDSGYITRVNPLSRAAETVKPTGNINTAQTNSITAVFVMNSNTFILNGRPVTVDGAPYVKDTYVMLSLAHLSKVLNIGNSNIQWDAATNKLTIKYNEKNLSMIIGQKVMTVGNTKINMGTATEIKNGVIYLPARWFSIAFGNTLNWHKETLTLTHTSANESSFDDDYDSHFYAPE